MKKRLLYCLLGFWPPSFLLAGCENKEAPGQLTVVEGSVLRHNDKVPFVGVPMEVRPYYAGFAGASYEPPIATTQTDADGKYSLRFYNTKGAYYDVHCDPDYTDHRLDFSLPPSGVPTGPTVVSDQRSRHLSIGLKNTVDFLARRNAVILLRLQLRNTRFQQLIIGTNLKLKANSLDTVIMRRAYWGNIFTESARLRRVSAAGQALQDSTVNLYSVSNIAADTSRVTFRFVR